jgi:Tfp pilus assembly protein PilZ
MQFGHGHALALAHSLDRPPSTERYLIDLATKLDSFVRVRIMSSDLDSFVERFAPHVTRAGVFLPSREPRAAGSAIRFEVTLQDGEVVFAGEGDVTWVKAFNPAQPKRAHGMGVKFTSLDPSSAPVLERLLEQREAAGRSKKARAAAKPESGTSPREPEPSLPPPEASGEKSTAETRESSRVNGSRVEADSGSGIAAKEPTQSSSVDDTAAPTARISPSPTQKEQRTRIGRMLGWSALLASAALAAVLITRARSAARDAPPTMADLLVSAKPSDLIEPARVGPPQVAAAPERSSPVQAADPQPAVTADDPQPAVRTGEPPVGPPPRGAPPVQATTAMISGALNAPPQPRTGAAASSIRVESISTGPSYKRYTCDEPTARFSLKTHTRVNVCFRVAHRPEDEEVTVVWEHGGALFWRTPVSIPGRRTSFRTRAHIEIDERRVGLWSARILSRKGVELARTSFQVEP